MTTKLTLALDVETFLFEPGNMAPRIVCVSFRDHHGVADVLRRDNAHAVVARWLEMARDDELVIVAHNAAYDFACIMSTWPDLTELVFEAYAADGIVCTKIREQLIDIGDGCFKLHAKNKKEGYSLEALGKRRLDRDTKALDVWRLRYGELDDVPLDDWPDVARDYAIGDAVNCLDLYEQQEERACVMGYDVPTQYLETRAAFALQLIHVWGIHTDGPSVKALWDSIEPKLHALEDELLEAGLVVAKGKTADMFGGRPKTKKSMKVIRARIEAAWPKELGDVPMTEGGEKTPPQISTSEDTIDFCHDAALTALVKFSSLQKQASTYVLKMFEGVWYPLHPGYDITVAFRSSCYGPNTQNQPRLPGVRECFCPREGFVFLAVDYQSQEMRTLAQTLIDIVGESRLAERYQADPLFDPHQEFASETGGERQHAKIANFGLPGGMGVRGLIKYAKGYDGQGWDFEFATNIRNSWFAHWPEMKAYFKHIAALVGPGGYGKVTIPRSGAWRQGCGYTDAANTYFQSLGAHCSKAAMFEATRRCYSVSRESWLYGARLVLFIHDEIVLEIREEFLHEGAIELVALMEEEMQKYTPDIPVKAEASAMRRWSKKAKPAYINGQLVPWEDVREAA